MENSILYVVLVVLVVYIVYLRVVVFGLKKVIGKMSVDSLADFADGMAKMFKKKSEG